MKLGNLDQKSILAMIETALFALGAVFFMLVLIIPTNPLWALIIGLLFGLAGTAVWLCPLLVQKLQRLRQTVKNNIESTKVNSADVAKEILADDNFDKYGYELHRADSYINLTDDIIEKEKESVIQEPINAPEQEPTPEPVPSSQSQQTVEPTPTLTPASEPE